MADTKISALTELTAIDDDDDVLAIVDITAGSTKKVKARTLRGFGIDTVAVTDASYTPASSHEIIIIDDVGDDTDIDITLAAALSVGDELVVYAADGGATGHTLVLGGSQTFDGTNQTANFNAAEDMIHIMAISATRVIVLSNTSVTFSA